ncbi:MAG: hypothetical protein AAB037_04200, partial [Chloroflexota bacterium]
MAAPYDTTSPDGTGGVPAARQIAGLPTTDPNYNPSVMSDYMIPRKLIAWEENLCEACHSATGPSSKNIQFEINKRHPVGGAGSGHPIDSNNATLDPVNLSGRHTVRESIPLDPLNAIPLLVPETGRPATLKHVECYDCHNPHAVKKGGNTPGTWDDGGRLKGVRYITINGTICDPVGSANPVECTSIVIGGITFTKTSPQPFIYELCFKCHGDSYASFIGNKLSTGADANPLRTTVAQQGCAAGAVTPASSCTDGSNKRLEFNPTTPGKTGFGADTFPDNRAFHPVAAPGRNTSLALCYQLKARGFPNIDCTDIGGGLVNSLANLTIY